METRQVVMCTECQVHWYVAGEPARCTTPSHTHRQFEIHRHRSVVELPDGTFVVAVSFDADDPYSRDRTPDYGLYLDHRWQPPWPHNHLEWPDFGVPASMAVVDTALRSVLDRARGGERVEVGCLGGHGRTGTALACLAILSGHSADTAVDWVRRGYCAKAVETPEQEAFAARFSGKVVPGRTISGQLRGEMQIVTVSWPDTVELRQNVLGWSAQPVNGDQEPETTHLAAVDGYGHPVGVVSMVSLPCPEYPERPGVYFWAMAVDERHQGRGIGRSLITEVLARARNVSGAFVWADARTSAIPFYERCGASAVGPSYIDAGTGLLDRRVLFRLF